jgi:hypothetical protein
LRGLAFQRDVDDAAPAAVVEQRLHGREERMPVGLRHAEQDADHLHRELRRDLDEEVHGDAVLDRREERAGPAAELRLEPAHGARREPGAHEPADPRVARIVHHVQHDSRDGQVLEQRPTVRARAAALR